MLEVLYLDSGNGTVIAASGQSISDYLLQSNMFVAAGAIYLLPQILKRTPAIGKLLANQWVLRFMPLYPLLAALLVVMVPGGVSLPDELLGTRMVAAVWMAFLAMIGHKVVGQTILGDDPRITTLAVESPGQKAPVQRSGEK